MPVRKIRKALFATKFRELAFDSLKMVFPLKGAGLEEIVLCHIIPREDVGFVPFGGFLKQEEERLREEARVRFEEWQGPISEAGLRSRIVIETGEAIPKLFSIAQRENVDLIIAGKKKRTEVEKIFLGSDTLEILRRSHVPVLVNKYMVEFEKKGEAIVLRNERIFEKPFLATDWSEPSGRALELLLSIKEAISGAGLLHIIETREMEDLNEERFQELKAKEKKKLEETAGLLKREGINAEYHLGAGNPASEVLDIAREFGATMLVLGTKGRGRLAEFLLGSVSHEVAELSDIPVILVP